jgi:hypothetical protein
VINGTRVALGVVFVAVVSVLIAGYSLRNNDTAYFQRRSRSQLKALVSAQKDFRQGDRDGNGVLDFWRKDVRGLYSALGSGGKPLRLIEASVARADAGSASKYGGQGEGAPESGYWYKAIRHADEVEPDPDRFAFCSYPETYVAGTLTFIIDEREALWRKDLGPRRGIDVFPADPQKDGWSRID